MGCSQPLPTHLKLSSLKAIKSPRHGDSLNNWNRRLNPVNPKKVPDPSLSGSPITSLNNYNDSLGVQSPTSGFEQSFYLVQIVSKLLERQKRDGRSLDIEVSPMLRTLLTIKPSLNYLRTQQVGFHINELIYEYRGVYPSNILCHFSFSSFSLLFSLLLLV